LLCFFFVLFLLLCFCLLFNLGAHWYFKFDAWPCGFNMVNFDIETAVWGQCVEDWLQPGVQGFFTSTYFSNWMRLSKGNPIFSFIVLGWGTWQSGKTIESSPACALQIEKIIVPRLNPVSSIIHWA
jgi:hypothetical protein